MECFNFFDEKIVKKVKHYVYALFDPESDFPFYIGKGFGNRVFNHVLRKLKNSEELKYNKIIGIEKRNLMVKHVIFGYGLVTEEALELESKLIDIFRFCKKDLANIQSGYHTFEYGVITTDELIRKFSAKKLTKISPNAVIININKSYKRCYDINRNEIYKATQCCWVINKNKVNNIRYVLSAYRGIIIEVFEVNKWYPVEEERRGKSKTRWGFKGKVAQDKIRNLYLNKSVPSGQNPVRFNI